MKKREENGIKYGIRDHEVVVLGLATFDPDEFMRIPDYVQGKPVRVIGQSAFQCAPIKSIALPSTLRFIEQGAFQNCRYLEVVQEYQTTPTSASGYLYLCDLAFSGCDALTDVHFFRNITSVSEKTFEHCRNLTTLDASLRYVKKHAFQGCKNLKELRFDSRPQLANHCLDDTAVETLCFLAEPVLPQILLKEIKKKNILIKCADNLRVQELAYSGFRVQTY